MDAFISNRIYTLYDPSIKEKIGIFTSHTLMKFLFGQDRKTEVCKSIIHQNATKKSRFILAKSNKLGIKVCVRYGYDEELKILGDDDYYLFTDKYNHLLFDSFKSFAQTHNKTKMAKLSNKYIYNNDSYRKWLDEFDTGEPHSVQYKKFIKHIESK